MQTESLARRVLIVDDEALIRWALAETLTDEGFFVAEAGSKAEALRIVAEDGASFDVVLLDFRLPDSDDLQLLALLRTLMPKAPVIMMTAFGAPDMVREALELGAFRIVSKPFEIGDMTALIKRAH